MLLTRPATITLNSTNAPETVALYNGGTTYAVGDQARSDVTHRIYQSLQNSNTGHAVTDTAWWVDAGPTNGYAMLDTVNGTVTTGDPTIEMEVEPAGRVDTIALLNLSAATVTITITDATDGVVHDETYDLSTDVGIGTWWQWYNEPIVRATDLTLTGLPAYIAPTIAITIDNGVDDATCGTLVIGQARNLGATLYGGGPGQIDYSRIERDEFGELVGLLQRGFARTGSYRVMVARGLVDEFVRQMALYRATPVLYIMSDQYGSTTVFGIVRNFDVDIAYPDYSLIAIELEGVT